MRRTSGKFSDANLCNFRATFLKIINIIYGKVIQFQENSYYSVQRDIQKYIT